MDRHVVAVVVTSLLEFVGGLLGPALDRLLKSRVDRAVREALRAQGAAQHATEAKRD